MLQYPVCKHQKFHVAFEEIHVNFRLRTPFQKETCQKYIRHSAKNNVQKTLFKLLYSPGNASKPYLHVPDDCRESAIPRDLLRGILLQAFICQKIFSVCRRRCQRITPLVLHMPGMAFDPVKGHFMFPFCLQKPFP